MDRTKLSLIAAKLLDELTGSNKWRDDPTLKDTPRRVAEMYKEMLGGHEFKFTVFPNEEQYDEIVLEKQIPFTSICAHHLVPFFGHVSIAYIPGEYIVGLSKLPRTVELFARRLQVQETLTQDIGKFLIKRLSPIGTAVIIEAEHLCIRARGIRKPGIITVTSYIKGAFRDNPDTRTELMFLLQQGRGGN